MSKTLLVLLFFLLSSSAAFALDIYSLIDGSCNVHSGLIVGVDDSTIDLLDVKGELTTLDRKTVNTVVIFNTLQTPIPEVKVKDKLATLAKDIFANDEDKPSFTGWPVRFVEELVIFYDTAGKTHVLDLNDVTKIRDIDSKTIQTFRTGTPEKVTFNYRSVNSHCPGLSHDQRDGVGPTRIIDDKINVSEFLGNFQTGFNRIKSYQERTYFYSKPFLFEKRSKLGIVVYNTYQENNPQLPIYFQWSTGKPYGFQTFNVFGSAPNEWIPLAEPSFNFRSDVKSHFFSGTFVGNILSLPAGSPYYANTSSSGNNISKNVFAGHQFNYLTLLGADYGPFTVSFGTFFPIFYFQVKTGSGPATITESREALANALSPAFRIMYNKGPLTLRAIYSATQESGSGTDTNNLRVNTTQTASPDNYSLVASFLRAGVDYTFSPEIKAGLDEIYSVANYTEHFGGSQYFFNSSHLTTSAYILQSFGHYISVKVYFNIFDDNYNYQFVNGSDSPSAISTSVGGAFEFDF